MDHTRLLTFALVLIAPASLPAQTTTRLAAKVVPSYTSGVQCRLPPVRGKG
jgi:hypothetical protein